MTDRIDGIREDFVVFLPDDLPLVSYDTAFRVDLGANPPELRVSTTLDGGSAEDLEDAGLFPQVRIPPRKPFTTLELRLDLVARDELRQTLASQLAPGLDPIEVLTDRPDDDVPPYRYLHHYRLVSWEIRQTSTASREVVDLAHKPPRPFDD